jgi:hypothetical protein
MSLLRMGKQTDKRPEEVVETAVRFFHEERGLEKVSQTAVSARFEGGGGFVQVQAAPEDNGGAEIDVQSREWSYDVRKFLETV